MTAPLRILHVVPHLELGGVTSVVHDLLRMQVKDAGLELQLCVLAKEDTKFPTFQTTVPIHSFSYGGKLGDVENVRHVARRLRHHIQAWQPGIVHSHLWPAALVTALAMRGLDTVHLDHVHDIRSWLASPRLKNRARRLLHRWLFSRCPTRFAAVADAVRRSLLTQLRIAPEHVTVILNGVDIDLYRPQQPARRAGNQIVIGTAGRFTTEKGHENLIHVIGDLHHRGIPVECHLAGSGSLQPLYERLVREYAIENQVFIHGALSDMPSFYRELDVFVLPSVEAEGLPITVLEAMAAGLPVVSTRVGGVEEVIRHGADGLIVAPGDNVAMAAALEELVRNQPLRAALGCEARQKVVKHFTAARMADDVRSLYGKLTQAWR